MHIIAGSLKGRAIPTAKNVKFRPSTGRFKEALFSILTSGDLADRLNGAKFLDLFSGSCAIGFEAISRGAEYATFIDIDRGNLDIAKAFAEKAGIKDQTYYLNMDVANLRYTKRKYNIVFIDPPYKEDMVPKTLSSLITNSWLEADSLLIIEAEERDVVDIPKEFEVHTDRKYGGSRLIILNYIK